MGGITALSLRRCSCTSQSMVPNLSDVYVSKLWFESPELESVRGLNPRIFYNFLWRGMFIFCYLYSFVLLCHPWSYSDAQSSILPAIAFSLDMFSKTGMSFGVNEVLLSSVLGSVVFSIFACQPLVIVGVTGKSFRGLITRARDQWAI